MLMMDPAAALSRDPLSGRVRQADAPLRQYFSPPKKRHSGNRTLRVVENRPSSEPDDDPRLGRRAVLRRPSQMATSTERRCQRRGSIQRRSPPDEGVGDV
jgi:hypothetical protein